LSSDTKECFSCKARGKAGVQIYFEGEDVEASAKAGKKVWKFSEPTAEGGRKAHEHVADTRTPGQKGGRAGWDVKGEMDSQGNITTSITFRVYEKDKVVDELKDVIHALRASGQLAGEEKR